MRLPLILALASPLHAAVTFEKQVVSTDFVAEGVAVADFNGDKKPDLAAGPYLWFGPDFKTRVAFTEPPAKAPNPATEYSAYFIGGSADLNGDKKPDILVVGYPGQESWTFLNPGDATKPWTRGVLLDTTDGESPEFLDVNGDGKPDLVCHHGGSPGYADLFAAGPGKPATFRAVAPAEPARFQRYSHGQGAGDLNGDGRTDLLVKDGWYEQPSSGDAWTFHPVPFSPGDGGSQMLVFDVNGDGRNDVVAALSAHGYGIRWFEQKPDGGFTPHVILGKTAEESARGVVFSQPHALAAADINGDGVTDFVSGKRRWAHGRNGDPDPNGDPVLYWFETKRDGKGGAEFVPHEIDRASGVGTQVVVTDIDGDGKADIAVANKSGVFVFRQRQGD